MVPARYFIQQLLQRCGWDVRRSSYPSAEDELLSRFLEVVRPDTVLDVGANFGQYGHTLRKCGFAGRIVSFEPLASVHARLASAAARDGNWLVMPACALGRAAGEARINVAKNLLSSSLLPMRDTHLRAAPESGFVADEPIRVARLDDLVPPLLTDTSRVLLKIDTQGYEEEVLAGAARVLTHVTAMQLELSVAPLYEGAPDLRRMLELCEGLGFRLHGLIPGFYELKSGRLLQMDGLFRRLPD
jgi:FkbM family methyltransferase